MSDALDPEAKPTTGDNPAAIVDSPPAAVADSLAADAASPAAAAASPAAAAASPAADAESPAARVRVEGLPLAEVGLAAGEKIEVLWEVEMSDGTDESVWWGAHIGDDVDGTSHSLTYLAQHNFEQETRRVQFLAGSFCWDVVLQERLPYRREGEEGPELPSPASAQEVGADEGEEGEEGEAGEADGEAKAPLPKGAIAPGTSVKSRFQGGERFCAGTIHSAHPDGTYDVLYDDKVLEENVPRDMFEVVELTESVRAAQASGDEVKAESIDAFFDTFVNGLTSGPAFSKLSAERQAIASEKVRGMRPFFEAELTKLRDERGWGALVTGEDIKILIPRVVAAQRAAA